MCDVTAAVRVFSYSVMVKKKNKSIKPSQLKFELAMISVCWRLGLLFTKLNVPEMAWIRQLSPLTDPWTAVSPKKCIFLQESASNLHLGKRSAGRSCCPSFPPLPFANWSLYEQEVKHHLEMFLNRKQIRARGWAAPYLWLSNNKKALRNKLRQQSVCVLYSN